MVTTLVERDRSRPLVHWSTCAGALVWLLGLVLFAFSGVIPSDTSYFVMGMVGAMLGVCTAPLAVLLPAGEVGRWPSFLRLMGGLACASLLVAGVLLMMGASGWLGQRAPTWIPTAGGLALAAFLGWMLLATYCTARSSWVAWVLAGAAAASFVLNFALSWFGRGLSSTAAGTVLGGVIAVLLWLCVPAWLVVVGLRK